MQPAHGVRCLRSDVCIDSEEKPGGRRGEKKGKGHFFISSLKNESSVIGDAA